MVSTNCRGAREVETKRRNTDQIPEVQESLLREGIRKDAYTKTL
jgi:hypothetical protein